MFRLNCCGERLNWEDGNKSCIAGVGGGGGGGGGDSIMPPPGPGIHC